MGASGVAPGMAMTLAMVLTALDAVTMSSRSSTSRVKSLISSLISSVSTLLDSMRIPSVDEKPVRSSSRSMSRTDSLSWSTQRIGSDSIFRPPSRNTPATNRMTEASSSGTAAAAGSEPRRTTMRSTTDGLRSVLRTFHSRMPTMAVVKTIPTTTRVTMPMASITPKSRIIGTCEISRARNATTPAMVATMSAGERLASVSAIGWGSRSSTTSSSTRFWIWIAKSIPNPMRIGSPEIVTSERSMPIRPSRANAQTTPMSTDASGSRRHRTRNISNRTSAITTSAAAPSVSMPPWR